MWKNYKKNWYRSSNYKLSGNVYRSNYSMHQENCVVKFWLLIFSKKMFKKRTVLQLPRRLIGEDAWGRGVHRINKSDKVCSIGRGDLDINFNQSLPSVMSTWFAISNDVMAQLQDLSNKWPRHAATETLSNGQYYSDEYSLF